ncbi:MAG: DUF3179 domain-containing (seleno)protein [Dehalococcoidia bacterium]|nr:DUF3179 domain-containing (seleno)protein [Dehalococcoidia bacterium]
MSVVTIPPPTHTPEPTRTTTGVQRTQSPSPTPVPSPTSQPTTVASTLPEPSPSATPRPPFSVTTTWEDATLEMRYIGWKTDFTKSSVPYSEIKRGGPPRDGITPIDHPVFETISEASSYMIDDEPVVIVELDGESRAYPWQS